ncbi:MAG: NAD(+)/NADH kinase [Geobacteraceae bacterium]
MKNIAIFAKVHDPRCRGVADELIKWLVERRLTPLVEAHLARHLNYPSGTDSDTISGLADLVVVLGGDGTLISVARLVGDREAPILGVNLGSLGFLTEITLEELYPALESCLAGDFRVSERTMLRAAIERDGKEMGAYQVLNDAVVNKGALARIVDLEVAVNGRYLTTFKADGLIISTPTGSTGYSLAANGPIIHPELDCLIITPICPHTLTNRPIVVQSEALITVRLLSMNEDVLLTLDGQVGVEMKYNDVVCLRRAEHRTRLVMSRSKDYFEVLRTKLKWGER